MKIVLCTLILVLRSSLYLRRLIESSKNSKYKAPSTKSLSIVIYNLGKAVGLQTRAADQPPIDVGLFHQAGNIVRFD